MLITAVGVSCSKRSGVGGMLARREPGVRDVFEEGMLERLEARCMSRTDVGV